MKTDNTYIALQYGVVAIMLLGGGTLIKIMDLQPVFIIAAAVVLTIIPLTSRVPLKLYLAIYQVGLVFFIVQIIHGFDDRNYEILSSQFIFSIMYTWIGFCVYLLFRNRRQIFTQVFARLMSSVVVYAIIVHLTIFALDLKKIVLVTASNAYYKGIFVFFSERMRTDYFGYDVRETIFGLSIPRLHGIFWEPSVFVMYAALLLYLGLYETRNRFHVILATIGLIGAQSLTGYVLLAVCYLWLFLRPVQSIGVDGSYGRKVRRVIIGVMLFVTSIISLAAILRNTDLSSGKIGSISQRFYDTAGAYYAISDNPVFGLGLNMDSYRTEVESENIKAIIDSNVQVFSLNQKDEIKYSNSVLRLFVKVGIPIGLIFLFGLYNQTLLASKQRGLLFTLIVLGSSAAPIMEMSFIFSLIVSGLIHSRG